MNDRTAPTNVLKGSMADAVAALLERVGTEVHDAEKARLVKRYLRLAGESL